jgi:prophage tail gpP-like protein
VADFGLVVNGKQYGGWKAFTIERSIETMCASFSFDFKEGLEGAWPVVEGDECAIVYGDRPVITGYAETASLSMTGDSSIGGRDRMADVVDSSPRLKKWSWQAASPDSIARTLCEPFGVIVTVQAGLTLTPLTRFSVDPGDTCGAALQKLCSKAGVLAVPTETGGLVLTRAGSATCVTALIQDENLRDGQSTRDTKDCFGEYRVLGQQNQALGWGLGGSSNSVKAFALDGTSRPQRMLILRPDGNLTPSEAKERAQWEASVRGARALTATGLLVQGWTQANGALWPLNALVTVRSPRLRMDGQFLTTKVVYARSKSGGTTTTLDVSSPGAFVPEPKRKRHGGWPELDKVKAVKK